MKPLYTIQELAHTLRLQPGTVRNKLSRGDDLPKSVVVGRRRLFPEQAVEAWLEAQEAQQATALTGNQGVVEETPKPVGRPRGSSATRLPVRESRGPKARSTAHLGHSSAQIALFGKE